MIDNLLGDYVQSPSQTVKPWSNIVRFDCDLNSEIHVRHFRRHNVWLGSEAHLIVHVGFSLNKGIC